MRKIILTFCIILSTFFGMVAQTGDSKTKENYIEVTGESEMLVVPDEIYISITIRERYEGREKITIDSLEHLLRSKLLELGVELKNLTLSDASSDYVKVRWTKKDVLTSKEFILKVSTASEASKVFEGLSKIKIEELDIDRVSHSKLLEFSKEVKINAVKSAKEKAIYLLSAINGQVGKTLRVVEEGGNDHFVAHRYRLSGKNKGRDAYSSSGAGPGMPKLSDEITFNKIEIKYKITARFEIK